MSNSSQSAGPGNLPNERSHVFDVSIDLGDLEEGAHYHLAGHDFIVRGGLLRQTEVSSSDQKQTGDVFGYFWRRIEAAGYGPESATRRSLIRDRLDDIFPPRREYLQHALDGERRLTVLDAGCGDGHTGIVFFEDLVDRIDYIAVDISDAIDIAAENFWNAGIRNTCIQCDLGNVPIDRESLDILFCPHVLQHTDDVAASVASLSVYLKPGGLAFLYCTKPAGPVRAASDKHVREQLDAMSVEEVFAAMDGITKLGKAFRDIEGTITVEEDLDVIGVKAGTYELQTFVFDYLLRAYYVPELSFEANKVFNLDWFGPRNYHGVGSDEFSQFCEQAGLRILERFDQFGSTTIIAIK